MLLGDARLDVADVLVQQFQVLLPGIVAHGGAAARALLHVQREALRLHRLVAARGRIIIGELHGRYLELALMAGYGEEVVNHGAFQPVGRQLRLVGELGIVLVEVLGEFYHRLLDELQVAHAADDDTQLDGIVGLHLGIVELGADVEVPYPTREVGRTLWQRVYLYLHPWSLYLLLHLDIAGAAVEEGLEGVDVAVLLDDDAVERQGRNLQLTRYLGEHDVLRPGHRAVGTAVDGLYLEALLLWQRHFLRVESVQVGHLALQLGQLHQRVHLVGQQDRLLLVDALLVGTDLDEQVGA